MRVRWTVAAKQDRSDTINYIVADNSLAAAKMDERFSLAAARLGKHPRMGRPGKIPGTRELIPHENYRLVYEIADKTFWILALVHTSLPWPPVSSGGY